MDGAIRRAVTVDANEAVASVAYRASEVIAIYPITPASSMGELADEWAASGRANLYGQVPTVTEMQSEGGAAGAVHGALITGALSTTFTASQGLLLMLPNMYKIAGELLPAVVHVAARTLATHALSIFGDHSDVMSARGTGWAMLAAGSVQEAQDFAAIAHAATLASRVPFLHFFDGFRTSHEIAKIDPLTDADLLALIDERHIDAHRRRALDPEHPVLRGSAQNPDTFFQAREACNPYYLAAPEIIAATMARFGTLTGRSYRLFDYTGHPEAERVIVMMGSGSGAVLETIDWLARRGERVGLVRVRLYRPFSAEHLMDALPLTTRSLAVLDRTKEPGALGEPLYLDVLAAAVESGRGPLPRIVGGRYGLSSKELTPGMVLAVFEELSRDRPKNHFTLGITDDLTGTSLPWDRDFDLEPDDVRRAVFFGLGADGTVGANKASIKIIGEETDQYAQGYFVYDSKKSGAITISHLRFGPRPIHSTYLIRRAQFVACHQFGFLDRYDVLDHAAPGATFLLNSPHPAAETWSRLCREVQEQILEKHLEVHVIDAARVAEATGMGRRINSVMQTCFFALSQVLPPEEAIAKIKRAIEKAYHKKGPEVVQRNHLAVDATLAELHRMPIDPARLSDRRRPPIVTADAPDFVQRVTAAMLANHGDLLPVSAFPPDGTQATGTSRFEKRNLAQQIPVWDSGLCIQCNKCAMVCPHAAIRAKVYPPAALIGAPAQFRSTAYRGSEHPGQHYTIQVAPEDCTGCDLCVMVCPAKDPANARHKALDLAPQAPLRASEAESFRWFLSLPDPDRASVKRDLKGVQFLPPLFEFSGACAGCGETAYVKLLTQLFGDRLLIANATGCSSIYGGNLPTTPYTVGPDGRGPAWANSLFEDNAEFGLGYRLSLDHQTAQARLLLEELAAELDSPELVRALLEEKFTTEASFTAQRERVAALRAKLIGSAATKSQRLALLADHLVQRSVWIVGGDGWAYDIGFGGLDHVMALGKKVRILVLDTEVYSNTGGQQSKATPIGASAKFAVAGKRISKKDLGLMAMAYGSVYVARVALGAKDAHTVKAFLEAESFPGTAMIIADSPCIAHGYDLKYGAEHQKLAVNSGYWPLYRYDPRRGALGESPLQLDSGGPKADLGEFMHHESRFQMLDDAVLASAKAELEKRLDVYRRLAAPPVRRGPGGSS